MLFFARPQGKLPKTFYLLDLFLKLLLSIRSVQIIFRKFESIFFFLFFFFWSDWSARPKIAYIYTLLLSILVFTFSHQPMLTQKSKRLSPLQLHRSILTLPLTDFTIFFHQQIFKIKLKTKKKTITQSNPVGPHNRVVIGMEIITYPIFVPGQILLDGQVRTCSSAKLAKV